jgi:GGDEF domain-containing protein
VDSVKGVLRSYDLIMRFGGDEFVCVLCGQSPAGLAQRFERAAADLATRHEGATLTVGFAQADAQDSPERLIERADEAMIAVRRVENPLWSR